MKSLLFVGEFPQAGYTNGIRQSNSILHAELTKLFHVCTVSERPLTSNVSIVIKFFYAVSDVFRVLYGIVMSTLSQRSRFHLSYHVLSCSLFGLIKSSFIASLFWCVSRYRFIHVHRVDITASPSFFVSFLKSILIKYIFSLSTRVISLSGRHKASLIRHAPAANIKVLRNTLAPELESRLLSLDPCARGRSRFLYLSNLFKQKGVFDFLSLFSEFFPEHLSNCLIAGSSVDANVSRSLEESRIALYGSLTDCAKRKFFAMGRCLIFPSYIEAQPITLLECMCAGLPFIAYDVGLCREISPPDYPYIIAPGINNLANAFGRFLAGDDESTHSCSLALRKTYLRFHSSEVYSRSVASIFLESCFNI